MILLWLLWRKGFVVETVRQTPAPPGQPVATRTREPANPEAAD
jgi:hypothetical protein